MKEVCGRGQSYVRYFAEFQSTFHDDRSIDRLDGRERKKENTLVAYQPLSSQLRVGRDVAAVVVAAIVVVEVEEVEEKLRLNDSPDCDSIYLKFSI